MRRNNHSVAIVVGTLSVNSNVKITTKNGEEIELWPFLNPVFYFLNKQKTSKLHIQEDAFCSYTIAYDGTSEQTLFKFDDNEKQLILQSTNSNINLLKDLGDFFKQLSGKEIVVAKNPCASPKCLSPARALSCNIYWSTETPTSESIVKNLNFLNSKMGALFMDVKIENGILEYENPKT